MVGQRIPTSSLSAMLASDLPDDAQTNRIWFGQYAIAAVLVAHRVGLFDRCHSTGWTSIDELAAQLEVHPEALLRLCRVLHCRKLLEVDIEGRDVQLTAQSTIYWRKDSLLFRGSQLEEVVPEGNGATPPVPYHQARILKMLREGGDPARSAKGTFSEMWSEGSVDPEATLSYNEFMRTQSFSVAIRAAQRGVYAGVEHFVDLGGGSAAFALVVKGTQPKTKCSIFDLPEVCDAAAAFLRRFPGVEVSMIPGSFFDASWSVRPDCFNLSNILHDWSPERCADLLANAYAHLAPGGRLVVSEVLLDEDGLGPEPAVVFDMLMYMNHAAQQLRLRDLVVMTERVGFVGLERVTTCGDYSVLVAKKPVRH